MKYILCILILTLSFLSCSSLRKATPNENRVMLDKSNFKLIEGKYSVISVVDIDTSQLKYSVDIMSSIFGGGYKAFKYGDNCYDSLCYVQFKVLNKKELELSYLTKNNEIKTTKIKGKLKKGYFVLKQSHVFLPFIVTNIYRNRQFRIGLLKNGNLITDHNEISMGTVLFVIPFYLKEKDFDVEFKRLD